MKISEAVALMFVARDGIQLQDYSEADQKRMKNGEPPKGVPIHRNL